MENKKYKKYGEPDQIARIKKEIEDTERMLSSDDETRRGDIGYFKHATSHLNVDEVRKSLSEQRKILAGMTPTPLKGPRANKAYELAKKLKAQIIDHMPKERYVSYPRSKDSTTKVTDFEAAVRAQMEWSQAGWPKRIEQYNSIMKRLDPNHRFEDFNRYTRERA